MTDCHAQANYQSLSSLLLPHVQDVPQLPGADVTGCARGGGSNRLSLVPCRRVETSLAAISDISGCPFAAVRQKLLLFKTVGVDFPASHPA